VITRNSYGALCLDVEDVLIADVDFGPRAPSCILFFGLAAPLYVALLRLLRQVLDSRILVGILGLVGTVLVSAAVVRGAAGVRRLRGGSEAIARRRIGDFLETHRDWRLRLYRTPQGLRLLVVHRTFAPDDPQVAAFSRSVGADPVCVRMCERQHCFRARLTPKPWRIGIAAHLKPRPGVWPIAPERLPARAQWVAEYERAAAGHAACRFVETLGEGPVDRAAEAVAVLHDQLSRAESGLPIA
jgi:hypothetical protein